jgi:hypothetical protein
MIALDTPIPFSWIAIGALLAVGVLAWVSLRLHGVVRPAYLWSLVGLRFWAFAAILLLLVNPYRLHQQPDPDGFRVAVLLDASGSMDTPDLDQGRRTRFNLVEDWLGRDQDSPLAALRAKGYRLDLSLFAEDAIPLTSPPRLLAGGTALGSVLQQELTAAGGSRADLGAVLLISDGGSNSGPSPIEAARQYRARGIPVSTIGIGSRTPPGEIRATFSQPRFQGERGQSLNLAVNLSNTRDSPQSMRIELHHGEGILETKEVTLPANSEERVTFSVTPFQAGGQAYRLVAKSPGAPEQVDVAAVEVNEPDQFRILYLGSQPSVEYRFLQQAVEGADQIQLEAIIRTGPESFFQSLRAEQERLAPPDRFPDQAVFFNAFDAVILDGKVLAEMGQDLTVLRNFVAHRGGGLLLIGEIRDLPPEFAALLPVVATEGELPFVRRELSVAPAPLFTEIAGGVLFSRPAVFLPEELPAFLATEWKRGARPILRPGHQPGALMAVQAYGAGRVGWLGSEATWRWRMATATGAEQHRLFWSNSLVWLASTGKPRLTVPVQGTRVPLAADLDVGIEVMGSDFRPAQAAEVQATVTTPAGETRQIRLQPSFRQPGRFETDFRPDQAGEYRIRYQVDFPEGEELVQDAFFIASHHDQEREEVAYREDVLRDIARLTGGVFYHHSEAANLREIPLAEGIPNQESRRHLASHPLFLFLLALPLVGEWYIRRRIGLK